MSNSIAKVTVLRKNFPATSWKSAFAAELMKLDVEMNPDAADELSDQQVETSRRLDPAIAAQRWIAARAGDEDARMAGGG